MIEQSLPQPAPDYELFNWECSEDEETIAIWLFHENGEYHVHGRNLDTGELFLKSDMTFWRAAVAEWEDFTGLPAVPEGEAV